MAQAPTSPGQPGSSEEADPSMDDILASIRRILDEDPAQKPPEDVLMLDSSMLVDEPGAKPAEPAPVPPSPQPAGLTPVEMPVALAAERESMHTAPVTNDSSRPDSPAVSRDAPPNSLVAPEAAAAAASSVGSLMRTLAAERTAALGRGGLTIEDLVREEIRPLLKLWLDTHLPPVVERLVRAEIERVVSRQAG